MSFFSPDTFTAAVEVGCSLKFLKALSAAGVQHDEKTIDAAVLRRNVRIISLFMDQEMSKINLAPSAPLNEI